MYTKSFLALDGNGGLNDARNGRSARTVRQRPTEERETKQKG
ncbi:hypothetical protein [Escherichia coli]|nr:hypothetical protein [Escherichia coli]